MAAMASFPLVNTNLPRQALRSSVWLSSRRAWGALELATPPSSPSKRFLTNGAPILSALKQDANALKLAKLRSRSIRTLPSALRYQTTSTSNLSRPASGPSSSGSSQNPNPNPRDREKEEDDAGDEEINRAPTFGQKLKLLMKKYGWAALGVYLAWSAVDFGAVFLTIYWVGAEHVRQAEDYIIARLDWRREDPLLKSSDGSEEGWFDKLGRMIHNYREKHRKEGKELQDSLDEGEKKNRGMDSSALWTTAVLAYTIHKTLLLPVRVGLTAATTPAIVKRLQRWGWKIGTGSRAKVAASATAAGSAGAVSSSSSS